MCHVPPSKQKNSPENVKVGTLSWPRLSKTVVETLKCHFPSEIHGRLCNVKVAKVQHAQVSTNVAAHGQGLRASTKSFGTATSAIIRNAPGA